MPQLGRGLSLLIGGARSGKSDLAVLLGEAWPLDVTVVATATAGDADMAKRIDRHQAERPSTWRTLEAPMFSADDVASLQPSDLVLFDCLTLLVANLMFDARSEHDITSHVDRLGQALTARSAPTILITNEVGLGIHPETKLGRDYRDILGRANRSIAATAETTLFVSAGKVLPLQDLTITW